MDTICVWIAHVAVIKQKNVKKIKKRCLIHWHMTVVDRLTYEGSTELNN